VNCSDVHLMLGAEPAATTPDLEAHLRECAACAQFRAEMQQLDEKIRRALTIEIPAQEFHARPAPGTYAVTKTPVSYSRSKQWALAASVLLAVTVVLVMWGALPSHSLAADVVSHVVSEPVDEPLDMPVDEKTVRTVMEQAGLRLDPIDPSIVFMRTCFIRGRLVPHFMVRTADGMATVMILPDEQVKAAERFEGSGYKGIIIPASKKGGSIALLSRSNVDLEHYAGAIRHAVHYLPEKSGS
jgi:uncharacterized protein DUF3379